MMIRISGNIWLSRIQPSPKVVRMPRRRARTYAAGSAIAVVTSAVANAIFRLFTALWMSSLSSSAIR